MADGLNVAGVADTELLYRAVRAEYAVPDAENKPRISSQAFFDRYFRPSVDRAVLCGNNPDATGFAPTDGVVSLTAGAVRTLRATRNDKNGNPVQEYVADVEPVPLAGNPAHAEIFGRPAFDNDKAFRRLCDALSRRASWERLPE